MRNIVLLCNMGMSTSLMVNRMKAAAREEGYECEIKPVRCRNQKK